LKKYIAILSAVFGALGYLYMIVTLIRKGGEGLSLSTFALGAALAWITGFTMLEQKANPTVPMIYGFGATITAVLLLIEGRCEWTSFDTTIAILVTWCIILWFSKGPRYTLVLSVAAALISFIPYLMMTWKNPAASPIIPNAGFLLANILAFVSAKTWTLEDRLYSAVNIVICASLVIPWLIF
jgi:hypothetical protein